VDSTPDSAAWGRLREIFNGALAVSDAHRSAFLDDACGDDTDLRREVERLLASHNAAGGFLETPPAQSTDSSAVPLTGRTLGPYQLQTLLGAGGMGDVYRALDTRLGRTVAVKLVARRLAGDRQFRERFEREARAIAAVTHPHICTLYDVGRHEDLDYLVMEYVEGETLAARLARGRLPVEQAVGYAIEIVSALDRAHAAGIVHRDLKPGNVMLTKAGVKLLDFGLAKAVPTASTPRVDVTLTTPGLILGTVPYMAPEQVEGRDADARTDLFAVGALLFEMLTGTRAFDGQTQANIVAAILERHPPPIATLEPSVPLALDRIVQTCLAKDPDERWQTARDLLRELRWATTAVDPTRPIARPAKPRPFSWPIAAGIVGLLAAAGLGAWPYIRPASDGAGRRFFARFEFPTPDTGEPLSMALSPDGRRLAFVAQSAGVEKIWLRDLDEVSSRTLPGTDGALFPFWSPDGSSLGFFANGKLRRVDLAGGPPIALADATLPRGGTWNRTGEIVFAPTTARPLSMIRATGGNVVPVTHLGPGEASHRWPQFLPDGRHFLFQSAQSTARGLFLASLDGGEPTRIMTDEVPTWFVAPDLLLTTQRGALVALAFEPSTGRLGRDPIAVVAAVGVDPTYVRGTFTASDNGVLAYRRSAAEPRRLAWLDRAGSVLTQVGAVDEDGPGNPELAVDGRRASVFRTREGNSDVWLVDADTGVRTRFTQSEATEFFAVWTPDGRNLVFSSNESANYDLFEKPANGAGAPRLLVHSSEAKVPTHVSPDGRLLIYSTQGPRNGVDIWAVPLNDPDPKPFPVLQSVFDEMAGQVSPDGRWLAYQSNVSGRMEVYVRQFPSQGAEQQISSEGGTQPRWHATGRELYFVSADDKLMAVSIASGRDAASLDLGAAHPLFPLKLAKGVNVYPAVGTKAQYAVSPNGRFLVNVPVKDAAPPPIVVTLNWDVALKKP
jgi:eukaryotic-like serine/threonine-protein kinase